MPAEGQARAGDTLARDYPGEWVVLQGDKVVVHGENAESVVNKFAGTTGLRLVHVPPANPTSVEDIAWIIAEATKNHYMTRGMQVSMGVTCRCGHWTGSEPEGFLGAGLGGRDQLGRHRAMVAAQALRDAGLV